MVLPGYEYATRGDYAVNSYPKASIFLYALRGLMGASAFDAAFAAYGERFRFRHLTTDDFLKTFLEKTPPAMAAQVEGFARAMLFSSSTLDVAILDVSDRETGKEGKRQWTVRVQRRGAVPLPVEIWAEDEAGEKVLLDTWRGPNPGRAPASAASSAARSVRGSNSAVTRVDCHSGVAPGGGS